MARVHLTVPALMTSFSGTTVGSYQTARSHLSPSETVSSYQTAHSAPPFIGTPSTTYTTYSSDVMNTPESEFGEDDTIIAIMGPTGVGKSTFVKIATGSEDVEIGHTLHSCTQRIRAIRCHSPQRNQDVVFVDTPGYDDDTRSDTEILAEVADWLEKTYRTGVKLSGILYLHRITDNRMRSTLVRNLDLFQNLCGNDALSNVRLVTTHWDRLKDQNQGIKYEGELRKKYWNTFLNGGSQMHRFEYSCSSAWQIVNSLPMERRAIQIQKEMVDQRKSFWETSAARSLLSWVHRAVEALKNFIHQLEELIQKITSTENSDNNKSVKDSENELKKAKRFLKTLEKDKSKFYERHSPVDSNHSSGPSLGGSTSTASTWRYVLGKISDRSERSIRRRSRHSPTLSTCSESTAADGLECRFGVPCDPPGPSSTLGNLSPTIQRLQAVRTSAAQGAIPRFEDVVDIALRISETLSQMLNAPRPLSSLMDSTSRFLFAVNDEYARTPGYPSSILELCDNIRRQLVNIQDIVTRLADRGTGPQMSSTSSLDDQRAITECREAVMSALRQCRLKVGN